MAVLPIFSPKLKRTATTAVFKEICVSFTNVFLNSLMKGLGGHLREREVERVEYDKNNQSCLHKSRFILLHTKEISGVPNSPSLPRPLHSLFFLFLLFVYFLLSHTPFLLPSPFIFRKLYPVEA